jgi:succinoglycan biosynthesis transport protein ExoP
MMSVQQQSFPITESRLITQATPPLKKSHPKTLLVFAIATAGGLVLALGLGMFRDFSDRVFRTVSQVESHLQVDCIAVLPFLKKGGKMAPTKAASRRRRSVKDAQSLATAAGGGGSTLQKDSILSQVADRPFSRFAASSERQTAAATPDNSPATADRPRTIVHDDNSILWQVVDHPFSRFTEGVRSIKLTGDLFGVSKSNKVIGVTSSLPNEGKSTVATVLAQLMAHSGSRPILIDGDFRNPRLTRELAPNAGAGLIELLSGKASLDEVIWEDPSTHLAFLPTVMKTRLAHTSELLASEATKKLFDALREKYDYVIMDLSPLGPVVDVRATTGLIDSYVFVIEWGRTKIEMVEHALGAARGVYDNLLGVVLNKANTDILNRYESYRGNYYYKRYYARYGYTE